MKLIIIYCMCLALVHGSYAWYEVCRRSDPNVNQCIFNKIEAIRPKLRAEPFVINRINADTSINGVKMKATLENVVAYRGYNLRIEDFRVNVQNRYVYAAVIKVVFPQLYVAADYTFEGTKLLLWRFSTNGKLIGKFDNVATMFYCDASTFVRNGVEYLRLGSVKAKVSFGNAQLHLSQADSSRTGRKIVSYARSDPAGAMQKLTPVIEDNAARLFKEHVNSVLAQVPLYLLLSD